MRPMTVGFPVLRRSGRFLVALSRARRVDLFTCPPGVKALSYIKHRRLERVSVDELLASRRRFFLADQDQPDQDSDHNQGNCPALAAQHRNGGIHASASTVGAGAGTGGALPLLPSFDFDAARSARGHRAKKFVSNSACDV